MEIAGQQQQDRATLCSLAFSDYQLWTNPFLRDPNRDGFTSIRTLFHRSHIFLADNDDAFEWTEASVVKCMSRDFFDLRMILVDKTRSRFAGGYEVRRKDWAEVTHRFPTFSPEYWDARTVYIENIPHQFRSTLGICKLLRTLLNSSGAVQHVLFPPHHQDPPDAVPRCKGFALVTLNEPDVVSDLLSRFPYDGDNTRPPTDDNDDEDSSAEESEARKAGFRTLPKERWETLQAEYAEYRESLLRRIAAAASSTEPAPNKIKSVHDPPEEPERAPAVNPPQTQSYPSGCVLFARHVPPDTNKTALRARFSALLADADALDYVDYSKGLDSCYLRLKTREHAQALLEAARSDHDVSAQEPELELLKGRREEMYWENVPEKVRALAVQRAHAQVHQTRRGGRDAPGLGQGANGDEEDTQGPGSASHAGGTRRKRRR
ncbi:hypothetical protein EDB83DRAFT_1778384 [Lactarius deliciosus]|nr:hypothetical protein EDB83DRAFT_1778384 [Lactarius deliciosus]